MSSSEFTVSPVVEQDRTAAIISYLTIIGFVVAIVIHTGKKTELGAFHLRQVLGLIIVALAAGVAVGISAVILAFIPFIGPILIFLLWAGLWAGGLALWVMGLIAALQGRQTPVPLIGESIQKWLANTFT